MDNIRVRFAPSPTGMVHVGSLRTAFYNFLFAKKYQGKMILRIEDTDQNRIVKGAVENLISAMNWAGIQFDEGPGFGGEFGPYVQSARLPLYQKNLETLVLNGQAYPCFCSSIRLEEMRKKALEEGRGPAYDRKCLEFGKEEVEKKIKAGETHVFRLKVPRDTEILVEDIVRGSVRFESSTIDDQVLLKSDGFPTYHLANVVDDHLMKISHVIRGEEWLSSTPKHVLLYQAFGWEAPRFAHLPLLLNPDRSKLSKRQGDVSVEDYQKRGFLPEPFVNFLSLLGWSPSDNREIFNIQELVELFTLERVNKSGAVFDTAKLKWFNGEYLKKGEPRELLTLIAPLLKEGKFLENHPRFQFLNFIPDSLGKFSNWDSLLPDEIEFLEALVILGKKNPETLKDLLKPFQFFCRGEFSPLPEEIKKSLKDPVAVSVLDHFRKSLQSHSGELTLEGIKSLIKTTGLETGAKGRPLFHNLRIGITHSEEGYDLNLTCHLLGKEGILKRIEWGLNQ